MRKEINDLGRYTRGFNLRFLGIEESDKEDCVQVLSEKLSTHLAIQGEVIENAHRTGAKKPGEPRHIIARFHSRRVRNQVIGTARDLEKVRPPFIVMDDLTAADMAEKIRVRPVMNKLYQEGRKPRFKLGQVYDGKRRLTEAEVNQMLVTIQSQVPSNGSNEETANGN